MHATLTHLPCPTAPPIPQFERYDDRFVAAMDPISELSGDDEQWEIYEQWAAESDAERAKMEPDPFTAKHGYGTRLCDWEQDRIILSWRIEHTPTTKPRGLALKRMVVHAGEIGPAQ